jgi:hypothetical protein
MLFAILHKSDAPAVSTHPPHVPIHWLIVLTSPILLLRRRFVLSSEPVAEMELAVTVAPYWPVVLILFHSFAPMDNVFEPRLSVVMLMAARLTDLTAVLMVLVLQVKQLAPQIQLVPPLPVLMVLVAQVVLQVCKRQVVVPT